MQERVKQHLLNCLLWLCLFIVALNICWYLLAMLDFGYPVLYHLMDIDSHISHYAPQNYHLPLRRFVETSLDERERLFAGIVHAINHGGEGLAQLRFYLPNSVRSYPLLTRAEVTHLQDVAAMVSVFHWLGLGCVVCGVLAGVGLRRLSYALYRWWEVVLGSIVFLGVISAVVVLVGPVRVFYWLHTLLFADNQWFFYYQESLMTTLMKAPDLFGFIALELIIGGFALFMLGSLWLRRSWRAQSR